MNDGDTTLASLKEAVFQFAREREWEPFHSPKNLSMALAAEAAELMEHFLWCSPEESRRIDDKPDRRLKVEDELADVLLYALQFANVTGTDLSAAIRRKMESNARRYPVEKAKGRSDKYTEYTDLSEGTHN